MTTQAQTVTHTPGPLIVCTCDDDPTVLTIEQDRRAIDHEPSITATVDLSGDGIDAATGKANAYLYAAAPELLAAGQYIDSCAETAVPIGEGYVEFRMTAVGLRQLRAAIAKATGH